MKLTNNVTHYPKDIFDQHQRLSKSRHIGHLRCTGVSGSNDENHRFRALLLFAAAGHARPISIVHYLRRRLLVADLIAVDITALKEGRLDGCRRFLADNSVRADAAAINCITVTLARRGADELSDFIDTASA